MSNFVADAVEKLSSSQSETQLRSEITSLVGCLGFSGFAYHSFTPKRGSSWFCAWPDGWEDHYQEKNYADVDPVVKKGLSQILPFSWDECQGGLDKSGKAWWMFEEGNDFGLAGGADIPIHSPGYEVASFSVYSDARKTAFADLWKSKKHDLHLIALNFHDIYARRFLGDEERESEPLTERESECLVWTARGKTSWEISQILCISERTVNFHVQNAMRKLDAYSKHHAVVRAVMSGLIMP